MTFSLHVGACALLLASACVEPVQYGGPIPIDGPGLQARLLHLCTLTGQATGCETLATPPAEETPDGG